MGTGKGIDVWADAREAKDRGDRRTGGGDDGRVLVGDRFDCGARRVG
jgi:hypothetical protein